MSFGVVAHAILFGQPFVQWPKRRAGKEWEAFEEAHKDDLIVTVDEHDRAMRMVDAVTAHRDSAMVLRGKYEVDREWSVLGRKCAGRMDVLGADFVTEFKTCSNAHPQRFVYGAMRLSYHAQLAWYLDGVFLEGGKAYMVAAESAPPYAVTIFEVTPRTLEEGRKQCRLWMETLLTCEASDSWPAYCQSMVPFDIPDHGEPLIIDGEDVEAA
jgi:exodeoxyribonuclease VIII